MTENTASRVPIMTVNDEEKETLAESNNKSDEPSLIGPKNPAAQGTDGEQPVPNDNSDRCSLDAEKLSEKSEENGEVKDDIAGSAEEGVFTSETENETVIPVAAGTGAEETFPAEQKVLEPMVVASDSLFKDEKKENEKIEKPEILTLSLDPLHQVASFLTPSEWLNFAQTSKAANSASREIIKRVRMHGFKCAAEVATAWKLGHHSDARELVALYVKSGVPIYPRSFGHSYHTLLWRMQVESREILHAQDSEAKIDPFFTDRMEFRAVQEYSPELTYVEEKCLYWTAQEAASNRPRSPRRRPPSRQNSSDTMGSRPHSPVQSDNESVLMDRVPVRVHKHLVDQHTRRKFCVNDNDGLMVTPGFSLSADFFHPNQEAQVGRTGASLVDLQSIPENIESAQTEETEEPVRLPPELNGIDPLDIVDADDLLIAQERRRPPSPGKILHALESCEVEPYTASIETSLTADDVDGSHELRKHLRSRFVTYQRRLEGFLAHMDTSGFEECIMDVWDEFFPHTAYIQYYDMQTAVPRVSVLHKFLTRPCPKAIGIVQCEIERIKINSRGKGVSMKGRLFPTYEYRLFIRHRPHNQAPESALEVPEDEGFDRRDTLLMVAKNRGRKHSEISGVGPTKKGSNNYYLYMPQQMDVDAHYNKVNILSEPSKMNPNGASVNPVILSEESSSVLMGRLQSNFIGTEFQIFTPRPTKRNSRGKAEPQVAKTVYSPSDDEVDYDSSYSSDTTSTLRSRLGRLRLGTSQATEHSEELPAHRARARSVPRSASSSSDSLRRPNRRAIANAEGVSTHSSVSEEEDGVITYTANLLGSRPRIMDVCIPRVNPDGVAGTDWRRYLEGSEEPEDGRMLTCFRQLLQRLENLDPQQPRIDGGAGAQEPHHGDNDAANPVAGNGGDDFGLVPLQNRPPWWNVELGSFVLNFGGRVSVASVKNFQLCDRSDQDNIMLQFGRIHGRHSFTMDFQYPLTAVQAFSIAISSLQSKISFG